MSVDIYLSLLHPEQLDRKAGTAFRQFELTHDFQPLVEALHRAIEDAPRETIANWPEHERDRYVWNLDPESLQNSIDILKGNAPYTLDGKHDRVEHAAQLRYARKFVPEELFMVFGLEWTRGVPPESYVSGDLVSFLYSQSEWLKDLFTGGMLHGAELPAPFGTLAFPMNDKQAVEMYAELLRITPPSDSIAAKQNEAYKARRERRNRRAAELFFKGGRPRPVEELDEEFVSEFERLVREESESEPVIERLEGNGAPKPALSADWQSITEEWARGHWSLQQQFDHMREAARLGNSEEGLVLAQRVL